MRTETVRRSYKYRLYRRDENKHLIQQIDIAGIVWNHALALSRRYYRLYGKSQSNRETLKVW
ncbi:MAG: helix-turn-helix domain-containing protein [Chloroflexota bacterium]